MAAFKTRFLSLFHAASSLRELVYQHQTNPFLESSAAQTMNDALDSVPIQRVMGRSTLRNVLMHNGMDSRTVSYLTPTPPWFGMLEALEPGLSLEQSNSDVTHGLEVLAKRLQPLLQGQIMPQENP